MADIQLANFLRQSAARPFVWGEFDCCLFFADWVALRTGIDPARDLRGTYSTEREMRRLVKDRGGIFEVVDSCMFWARCWQTDAPKTGDIGLVRVGIKIWRDRIVMVPVGAIAVSSKLWAIKTSDGHLPIAQFPLVRAWGVNG